MALPLKFSIHIFLFITSIFGTAILSLTNLHLRPSSMMMQQNEGGQCLPIVRVNEGDSPQTIRVPCTIDICKNNGDLLYVPDITTLWSVIRLYYKSTLSRLSNHPVYWMLIRLLLHSVMLSSYCSGLLWDWMKHELSLWTCYLL